jgi:hypothetical protein
MKNMLLTVAALALAFTLNAQAQLVLSPTPPPTAHATITETQFDALIAAAPALPPGQSAATVQGVNIYGFNLTIRFATVGGVTLTEQVTLTPAQLSALEAALPALPTGETAANIRNVSATRLPSGGAIMLVVGFSK